MNITGGTYWRTVTSCMNRVLLKQHLPQKVKVRWRQGLTSVQRCAYEWSPWERQILMKRQSRQQWKKTSLSASFLPACHTTAALQSWIRFFFKVDECAICSFFSLSASLSVAVADMFCQMIQCCWNPIVRCFVVLLCKITPSLQGHSCPFFVGNCVPLSFPADVWEIQSSLPLNWTIREVF